ncbi:hypothetical protein E2C01_011167 [Portunus trituberculatus]|uniref:Uncharacterized protein n=1 Tax=Portunus trituberculatus TaxID=210409 RepID=A0A5B7DAC6_PORTR|nr:hypothetical protein [Portunus trituberculatus]
MEEKSLKIAINFTGFNRLKEQNKHLFKELHHNLAIVLLWWVESIEVVHVSAELLHSASTESVTCCNQHTEVILHQPECNLVEGKTMVGGLADTVHATESHGVGAVCLLGLHHVTQDVKAPLGGQQLHQGLCQGVPHSGGDALKDWQSFPAISAATFFPMRWSFSFSRTGSRSASVRVFPPTSPRNMEKTPPAEYYQGLIDVRNQKMSTLSNSS